MWIGNVLYGRPGSRAYRLDLDTVRELGDAITSKYPDLELRYLVTEPIGSAREVTAEQLNDLSARDLQRLSIDARLPWPSMGPAYSGPLVHIALSRNSSGMQVSLAPDAAGVSYTDDELFTRLMQIIEDASRPLLRRRQFHLKPVAAWVPFLALLAGWVWLEVIIFPLPIPLYLMGWALVILALVFTRQLWAVARARAGMLYARTPLNGHLVVSETRAETAARRADQHRDLRVALLSIGGTIVAGLVVALVLYLVGIRP